MNDFLSVAEVAEIIGRCPKTIHGLIRAKKLKALDYGVGRQRAYRVPRSAVEEYMRTRGNGG